MSLIKCPECGRQVSDKAVNCPGCGCPISKEMIDTDYALKYHNSSFTPEQYSDEKKRTTLLLCVFGGYLGLHRFYAGHYGIGVLYFLTGGLFLFGWIRDIICLLDDSFFDTYDKKQYMKNQAIKIQKEMHEKYLLNPTPFHILAKEIGSKNNSMNDAVKQYVEATGLDFKTATEIMFPVLHDGKSQEQIREEQKEINKKKNEQLHDALENLSNTFNSSKVARCPKCHSTSISYQDKISYGRAAVGGLLAGGTGAILGGLTGKKGYAVCLNCGKRWKV